MGAPDEAATGAADGPEGLPAPEDAPAGAEAGSRDPNVSPGVEAGSRGQNVSPGAEAGSRDSSASPGTEAGSRGPAAGALPPALSIVAAGDTLSPAREIAATTTAAKILFTRDDFDTTYVSGRRGMMVLSLVEDGTSYRVGRYDVESGEWRILSKGWPRFGNALAFACTIVS
jgi:hypothetical protein